MLFAKTVRAVLLIILHSAGASFTLAQEELDFALILHPGPASHEGNSVAVDADRNIYLTGQLNANRFENGQLYADIAGTNFVVSQAQEYFLMKYDAEGEVLWAVTAGGPQADHGNCVRIAPNGEPVVVLTFTGTNLHGTTLANAGQQDFVLARYSTAGQLLWTASAGGTGRDAAFDLGFDPKGDIYIVGRVNGTAAIGNQTIGQPFQDTGYLAKYTAGGGFVWAKALGRIAGDVGLDINPAGKIYITGNSNGGIGTQSGNGIFVAEYDLAGNNLWVRIFAASSTDGGTGIVAIEEGLYVVGTFTSDTLTLGETILTSANRQLRGFAARFTLAGEPVWAQQLGGRAYALAVAPGEAVYAGGFYSANSPLVAGETPPQVMRNEAYLVQLATSGGALQKLKTWTTDETDIVRDVIIGPDADLYLAGEIPGALFGHTDWQGRAFVGRVNIGGAPEPSGPQLTLRREGSELILAWPAEAGPAVLESTPELGQPFAPSARQPSESSPAAVGIPIGAGSQFFRLKMQP